MKTITSSEPFSKRLQQHVRIVWAIVLKDMVEALKNKNTLAILLTSLPMVLFYYYFPILTERGDPPAVFAYDAGESVLVALLENSDAVRFRSYPSQTKMIDALMQGSIPELGLVIPENFDQAVASGTDVELQGYVLHWVSSRDAQALQQAVQTEISTLVGHPAAIQLDDNRVFPDAEAGGIGVSAGIALVYVVTIIGLLMIPHLMLEEKKTGTIDALLVSPASETHLILGKALTGMFYCLLGGGVALFMFRSIVLHWGLAGLNAILLALISVFLGLILGIIIESREQLTLLAWFILIPLFIPMFVVLLEELVPAILVSIFRLVPSSLAMANLRISAADRIPWTETWFSLILLVAWSVVGFVVAVWLLRWKNARRENESAPLSDVLVPREQTGPTLLDRLGEQTSMFADRLGRRTSRAGSGLEQSGQASTLRLIWAIASKDLGQAFQNRLMLSILLGTGMVVLTNAVLPLLLRVNDQPIMLVYDEGRSTIIRALAAGEEFRMGMVESREDLDAAISSRPEIALGIVLPEDFDQLAGSSELINLDAYVVHWADTDKVNQRVAFFEEQLSKATWGAVRIDVSSERVYPESGLSGQLIMNGMVYLITILTIGVALVPLLIVEERRNHTLEVLLVSPASLAQVIAGKGIVGLIYCLITAAVVYAFNQYLIVHWGVALLAAILGALFAVGIGLLVGLLSDNPTTVSLYGGLILLILFVVSFLSDLIQAQLAPWLEQLLSWLPPSALIDLFGYSLVGPLPVGSVWVSVAALLAASGLVFLGVAWVLQRYDR